MAKDWLYKVVSNENVASALEVGLSPRPGGFGINEPRVWLVTNINAAYKVAHNALIRRKDFHVRHISAPDEDSPSLDFVPGWTWSAVLDDKWRRTGWRLVKTGIYSVITIDRAAIKFFPGRVRGLSKQLQRAIVWTPDTIPPSAFRSVQPIDGAYFQSATYRRFIGEPVSLARVRSEAARRRQRWLIDVVETRDGGLRFRKVRNPDYITIRGQSRSQ